MPDHERERPRRRHRGRRAAGIVGLLLALAVAALLLALDKLLTSLLESRLHAVATAGARIGRIDLSLLNRRVVIEHLTIENPRGCAERNFLEIPRAEASFEYGELLRPARALERLTITNPRVTIVIPADGQPNIKSIFVRRQRPPRDDKPRGSDRSLLIRRLDIEGLSLAFVDQSSAETPHRIELRGACLRALQFTIGGRSPRPETDLRLTGYLGPGDWPSLIYARAWSQPFARGTEFSLGAHLAGFDLALARPYLLPAADAIIGSSPIDIGFELDRIGQLMDGSVSVRTARAERYTLRFRHQNGKVIVDKGSALLQAFKLPVFKIIGNRIVVEETIQEMTGTAVDVISGMASTGRDAARASVDVVTSAGQGNVVGVAKGIGQGIGHLAGGVLGLGKNIAGAAVGITSQVTDLVQDATGTAQGASDAPPQQPDRTLEELLLRHEVARLALLRGRLSRAEAHGDAAIAAAARNEIGALALGAPSRPDDAPPAAAGTGPQ